MIVGAAGNIGIGNIAPLTRLHITGGEGMTISSGNLWFRDQIAFIGTQTNHTIYFRTNNINRMVIGAAGNIGIGTNPSYLLHVGANSAAKPGSNTWTVASDERLKTITGTYNKGLAELMQLQAITYYYKDTGDSLFLPEVFEQENIGFSAQAVQEVFPEAVAPFMDGRYLGLDIHPILIAYLNAIKELNDNKNSTEEEIELLKAQNEELQARLIKLEKLLESLVKN
jgi:hypothetical protein